MDELILTHINENYYLEGFDDGKDRRHLTTDEAADFDVFVRNG